MIDAYEIGIQLALQDGVSAGLQVIARELGALDRAVAATAGRLEGLTRTAAEAQRAVAAVGGGRTPAAAGPEVVDTAMPDGVPAAIPVAGTPRAQAGAAPVALPVGGTAAFELPAAVPGVRVAASAGPVAPAGAVRVMPAAAAVAATPTGPASPSVTPAAPMPARLLPEVAAGTRATPVSASPAPPTRPAATAGLLVLPVINPPPQRTPPAGSEQAAMPAASGRQPAAPIRGSMPELVAARGPVMPRPLAAAQPRRGAGRVDATPPVTPPVTQGIAAAARAPVSPGVLGRGLASSAVSGSERRRTSNGELGDRPATPVGQSQEGGRSGGDVMLDGRLVGHWLADRMGRDAGRPSAGTTAFDARQAPAWAPSGSF